jgi:hypothetical protein
MKANRLWLPALIVIVLAGTGCSTTYSPPAPAGPPGPTAYNPPPPATADNPPPPPPPPLSNGAPPAVGTVVPAALADADQGGYPPPPPPPDQGGYPPQDQGGYPPQDQGGYPPEDQGTYPPPPPPDQGYDQGYQQGYDQGYQQGQGYDQGPVAVADFYQPLAPYGDWVQSPTYGWVWVPRDVGPGWRPYTEGHWVYTDAGWAWDDDQPWGWACFHYGRWFFDAGYGWEWLPGTVWGPAWVSWQFGGGFIGWAPLPPAIGWSFGVGLELGGVDLAVAIRPWSYCFVRDRDILTPRLTGVILPPARNVTLLRTTRNVTSYAAAGNRVVNRGVPVSEVERAVGRRVEPLHLATAPAGSPGRATVRGREIAFFRPRAGQAPRTAQAPPPAGRPGARQPSPSYPAPGARPYGEQYQGQRSAVPAPPARAPGFSAEELGRRHQVEQQALETYHQQERQRLEDLHRREIANPPGGFSRDQLGQRHAEEMRAMQEQQQRERQAMESRHQRERQSAGQPPPRPPQREERRPPPG